MAAQSPAQVRWILYGALFSSTILYLVVLQIVGPQGTLDSMTGLAIAVVAFGTAGASQVLPRIILHRAIVGMKLPTKPIEVASDSPILRDAKTTTLVFANPRDARARVLAAAPSAWILGWALAEAVAIYGFVLRFLGASWTVVLPFFGISWLLFAVQPPREKPVFDALEEAAGAKLTD